MHTYSVLSVLFAPAVVLGSALFVFLTARLLAAISRPLRRRLLPPADRSSQLPPPRGHRPRTA